MSRLRKVASSSSDPLKGSAESVVVENDPQQLAHANVEKLRELTAADATKTAQGIDAIAGGHAPVTMADIVPERTGTHGDRITVQRSNEPVLGGQMAKSGLQAALGYMAAARFSPDSQKAFAKKISDDISPKTQRDVAYLKQTLSRVLPKNADTTELDKLFESRGMRLRTGAPHDPDKHFASLDRVEFRREVNALLDKAPDRPITREEARAALAKLQGVADLDDLDFARWQIMRRTKDLGQFKNGVRRLKLTKDAEKYIRDFFRSRLDSKVAKGEVALSGYSLRRSFRELEGASGDGLSSCRAEVAKSCNNYDELIKRALADRANPDNLFYAKRVVDRGLAIASSDEARATLRGFSQKIASKAGDRLDRYSANKRIDAMARSGAISIEQAYVMRVGIATSVTKTELAMTTRRFEVILEIELKSALAAVQSEIAASIMRIMNGLDEHGNPTEAELARRQDERLQDERLREKRLRETQADLKSRAIAAVASSVEMHFGALPEGPERDALAGRAEYLKGEARSVAKRA